MKTRKVVVYSGTRVVYRDMAAACNSLTYYNPEIDKIYLLAEDEDIGYQLTDREKIEILDVSGQMYFTEDSPNYARRWSYMILLRAVYPDIFKDEDLVLSLDIDTIINKNIKNIWLYDLADYCLAGVQEPIKTWKNGSLYINFGVVMMNLKKLRETGIWLTAWRKLQTEFHGLPEQDVFNELCTGKILELPSWWNTSCVTLNNRDPYIWHFAGPDKKDQLKERQRRFIYE